MTQRQCAFDDQAMIEGDVLREKPVGIQHLETFCVIGSLHLGIDFSFTIGRNEPGIAVIDDVLSRVTERAGANVDENQLGRRNRHFRFLDRKSVV